MTEQARKDMITSMALHGRPQFSSRLADKVVTFSLPNGDAEQQSSEQRGRPAPLRDWSSAVDLIQEASEAIRISEQRAEELEAHINQVITQASEEMRQLNAQIHAGEQKLARSEERARLAEARASEAEAWLVRLHDAVFTAFAPVRNASSDDAGHPTEVYQRSSE